MPVLILPEIFSDEHRLLAVDGTRLRSFSRSNFFFRIQSQIDTMQAVKVNVNAGPSRARIARAKNANVVACRAGNADGCVTGFGWVDVWIADRGQCGMLADFVVDGPTPSGTCSSDELLDPWWYPFLAPIAPLDTYTYPYTRQIIDPSRP